jgi:Uma2 family endonuclease
MVRRRSPATRVDLEALPAHIKGEIIDGVLYTQPRPRASHSDVESALAGDLKNPYQYGSHGPGGWWILTEPGIELAGSPEFAPDLAGWRKERMPRLPSDSPIVVVPDWVCEILSPGTRNYDHRVKRPFYARIGVQFLWYADLEARTLSVSQLAEGRWAEIGVYGDDDRVRAQPFPDVELELAKWWPGGIPQDG